MDAYEQPNRRRPRRGLPSATRIAEGPDLFATPPINSVTEPRTRATDRATSRRAARRAATGDLSATQTNILHLVREYVRAHGVGITDDQLVIEFRKYALANPERVRCPSPQRIRTARADLVRLRHLRDTGQLASSDLGNDATTWEPALFTMTEPVFFTVPAGTKPSRCRGRDCGDTIFWVEKPRAGKPGTARIPVHCDVPGGVEPDAFSEGKGVNHFTDCANAADF